MPLPDSCSEEALLGESSHWPGQELASRGLAATVFNVVSSTIGAGVLTTGYLFRRAGWLAIAVVALASLGATYTAKLIPQCLQLAAQRVPESDRLGQPLDWPVIGQAALGRQGKLLVQIAQSGELLGAVLSFLVFQGGILSTLVPLSKVELTGLSGSVVALMLLVPGEYLAYFSFLGIVALFAMEGSAVASGLVVARLELPERTLADPSGLPEVLSIVFFLYSAHAELPSLFLPLRKKRLWPRAAELAFAICGLIYISTGSVIYLFWGAAAQEDLTENVGHDLELRPLPQALWLQPLTALLFAAKLQVSFPLFTPPLTDACEAFLGFTQETPHWKRALLKVTFAGLCTCLAMLTQAWGSLTAAMKITGCVFSSSTTLILPTAFYLQLTECRLPAHRIVVSALMGLSGLVIMFLGLWDSLS